MAKQLRFAVGDKQQVNFYFSKKKYLVFKSKYPNLTSWFLSHCLERAITEKNFVNDVLIGNPIKSEVL